MMFDETPDSNQERESPDGECEAVGDGDGDPADDTLARVLTAEERAKLAIDAWEPSLLRHLLDAHGKLGKR